MEHAEKLKELGNSCFNKERFAAAIDAYTEALYMLGLAMIESKQLTEGIKHLEKAMEVSKAGKHEDYIVFTWDALAKAKYEEWECGAALRQQKQQELRSS